MDGVGDDRDAPRRHTAPDAWCDSLRRARRARVVGALLPGARRLRHRHGRRRRARSSGAFVILVAGGTGRLGTLVVARLAARGHEVRVLSRDRSPRALPAGVEFVGADVREPATLVDAFEGVTTV